MVERQIKMVTVVRKQISRENVFSKKRFKSRASTTVIEIRKMVSENYVAMFKILNTAYQLMASLSL